MIRRMAARTIVAVSVVALAACGVQPSPARVAGVGPDTQPGTLAEQDAADGPADPLLSPGQPERDPRDPDAEEAVATETSPPADVGEVWVMLRDASGGAWVARESVPSTGDPAADVVATLARPLTDEERQAGLQTDVPPETVLAGHAVRGRHAVLHIEGSTEGGTDAALWRRSQQLACTVLRAGVAGAAQVVEVRLHGESVASFGSEAEPCP